MTAAPAYEDVAAIERLRAALDTAGYTSAAVKRLLGEGAFQSDRDMIPVHARRVGDDAVGPLIRAFFLGVPVDVESLVMCLGPAVTELPGLGLAELRDGELHPLARIVPHEDILLAADPYPTRDDAAEYVAGYTASADLVQQLTVRRPIGRALDLGTGSGVHALLAAVHSEDVVATDVNERAIAYTAFNARLNGLPNVETRQGSLLEPVAGERFDLITFNGPYVVSPELRFAFRDAGLRGDAFSEQVVRSLPDLLEEGGFATVSASWIGHEGEDWSERPRGWLNGNGCDAWILQLRTLDVLTHAAMWNQRLSDRPTELGDALDVWLEHFRELGADWVAEGILVLRRRGHGQAWTRADRFPDGEPASASDQILRVFGAGDRLNDLMTREAILDEPLRLAETVRFDGTFAARGNERVNLSTRVRLEDGLPFVADVNQETAELLARLEAAGTVRAALGELEQGLGLSEESLARLTSQALEIVEEMWATGFLVTRAGRAPA